MCETTRKPNTLANTMDKEVIHQNVVGWLTQKWNFAMQDNFAR